VMKKTVRIIFLIDIFVMLILASPVRANDSARLKQALKIDSIIIYSSKVLNGRGHTFCEYDSLKTYAISTKQVYRIVNCQALDSIAAALSLNPYFMDVVSGNSKSVEKRRSDCPVGPISDLFEISINNHKVRLGTMMYYYPFLIPEPFCFIENKKFKRKRDIKVVELLYAYKHQVW
jgi:hypothetical protein